MTKKLFELKIPIGAVAEKFNIAQRTLIIYDKMGILVPNRTLTNRRYYTTEDIKKLEFILYLTKGLALNLVGVQVVLGLLKKYKVKPDNYLEIIKELAKNANLKNALQTGSIHKKSQKDRKPNKLKIYKNIAK